MNVEYEIQKINARLDNLQESFIQAQRNQVPITAKVDDSANQVKAITPYTATQIGYYGETEKTFYDVPDGNVTVFGLKEYALDRISDRLTITFDALSEQTEITISIL